MKKHIMNQLNKNNIATSNYIYYKYLNQWHNSNSLNILWLVYVI